MKIITIEIKPPRWCPNARLYFWLKFRWMRIVDAWQKADVGFRPFEIRYYPKFKNLTIWVMMFVFYEGDTGWMLFGLSINEFGGYPSVHSRFVLTIFGHHFIFGRKTQQDSVKERP
jgi:hypothetical protein